MPKVERNIMCVSYSELVVSGIVSRCNYKNMLRREKLKPIVNGGNGREAMIEYSSLPAEIKAQIVEMFGDPTDNYSREMFKKCVITNYKAREYFAEYVLEDGRFLPFDVQETYSRNCEVMDAVIGISNNSKAFIKALGGVNKNLWANICRNCNELSFELGHDLPKNDRRLKLKVKEYQEKGFEAVVSKKFMNKNSAKVCSAEQEATIRELLRKHNNFNNVQVADLYNFFGEKLGWEMISASTIGNYRKEFDLDTVAFRNGPNAFDNTKAMQVKRSAPVLPMLYWTADGWDAELLYQKTVIDDEGKTKTTYHNRLTIVFVLDVCGKYPVGYAVGDQENSALIREAFRNAVKHTEELFGAKHRVGQLQTDNYGRGALTPFYETVSRVFTPAKVGNAKSKVIEPYNKYFNKTYCQLMPNWSGFGVLSRKESQPNADWINKNRHAIPNREQVIAQLDRFIEIERSKKQEAYLSAYEELPNEERLLMSEADYYLGMCESTGRTNRLSHEGLVLQVNNEKTVYDCFERGFRANASTDWKLHFDPADMSKAMAVNESGSLRFMLSEKHIQPMAIRDASEEDNRQLKQIKDFNVDLKQGVLDRFVEDAVLIEDMLNDNPQLNDTLQKLILTDNQGQHKNNRNAIRLGKVKEVKEVKETKARIKDFKAQDEEYQEYLNSKVDFNSYITAE